jgi:tetratricopeptide (TPR) repeat protein
VSAPFYGGPSRKSRFRARRPEEEHPAVEPAASGDVEDGPEYYQAADFPPVEHPESLPVLEDRPSTVARPREKFQPEGYYDRGRVPWLNWLSGAALLAVGGVAGYFIGGAAKSATAVRQAGVTAKSFRSVDRPPAFTEVERTALDAAYLAGREGRYADSERLFTELSRKHPGWVKVPLEIARMDIYQGDNIGAQQILGRLVQQDSDARPDAFFLAGVLNLKAADYADAETSFAAATDADPTRSEYYYFWGDCLRQDGKPLEAEARFRSALARNQYETAENLLQLKVWLCDITMDQEQADGTDTAINAGLTAPFPRAAVLLAAGARALKAGDFKGAAGFIGRGQAAMDQVVFRVVMRDPSFLQESWRPELASFYQTPSTAASAPPAAPPPSKPGAPSPAVKKP